MHQRPTILTGIRSNESPTLGNYFGAIKPLIDMAQTRSDDFQVNIFVPDLHSFTTTIDHGELYQKTIDNIRLFVAAGLPVSNPNVFMYRQSFIPAHSELTWILDCFTGFGQMGRMTQFKEKSQNKKDNVTVGLFNYPVLMAADILLYGASYVPVGDDQAQHLEFARDIAERMNQRFGKLFVTPEPVAKQYEFFGRDRGLRVMDLAEPMKKMSKSNEIAKGVIFLNDRPADAARKIMSAETDSLSTVHFDRDRQPGISNLLEILSLVRDQPLASTVAEFEGNDRYGDFKKIVATEVEKFLNVLQAQIATIDDDIVMAFLATSEQAMTTAANRTLTRVQQAVGLRPREV